MSHINNVHPTIPATDLDRAQRFYTEVLGMKLMDRDDHGLNLRNGQWIARVFGATASGTALNTLAGFGVKDVESVVRMLQERGVTFEEYDTDQIRTVDSVARLDEVSAAWFRDSEGNIIAVSDGIASDAVDLSEAYLYPTIPVTEMDRARAFYTKELGLGDPVTDTSGQGLIYQLDKSLFYLFPSPGAGSSKNTAAGFTVGKIEKAVDQLRERGVTFEEYDLPTLRTVGGIADVGLAKAAWFSDTEGNLVALVELSAR